MPAAKALILILLGGLVVATGVFIFVPSVRPAFVDKWFRTAQGITPAQTPREALEKFHERLLAKDYKNAALYIGGPYSEEMKISGDAGKELAIAVENVQTAMDNKNLNSGTAKLVLALLQPFPKDMKIIDVKHKEGEEKATARLDFDIGGKSLAEAYPRETWKVDPRIFLALFPKPAWQGGVELKLEGDGKEKGWRIYLPVTLQVRESASYLKSNYGNYVSALNGFSRDIKNNPYTVDNLVNELKKCLEESSPK